MLGTHALGAAEEPGLLQVSDLSETYQQVGAPVTESTVLVHAIDAEACTLTFEVDRTATGPYVVVLNILGNGEGPSVKELKAIARTAEQRLREGA